MFNFVYRTCIVLELKFGGFDLCSGCVRVPLHCIQSIAGLSVAGTVYVDLELRLDVVAGASYLQLYCSGDRDRDDKCWSTQSNQFLLIRLRPTIRHDPWASLVPTLQISIGSQGNTVRFDSLDSLAPVRSSYLLQKKSEKINRRTNCYIRKLRLTRAIERFTRSYVDKTRVDDRF